MHYSRVSTDLAKTYSAQAGVAVLDELLKGSISLGLLPHRTKHRQKPNRHHLGTHRSESRIHIARQIQTGVRTWADSPRSTYQMKILTTAGFSVLRKRLSTVKWHSLLGLVIGVGVVQIQTGVATQSDGSGGDLVVKHVMNPLKGFLALPSACVTSGLAGVSMVLKGSQSDL